MQKSKVVDALRGEGFVVTEWTDEPNTTYERHAHPYREVRVVLSGDITFIGDSTSTHVGPGDRIDFEPGASHSARVGPNGATYLAGTARG
jgi:quercetin dioxygenase-like cupin family protein